jgi:hypothetical protein
MQKTKLICKECGWKNEHDEPLTAPNPFNSSDIITGCPACRCVNSITIACDAEKCWEIATCGRPIRRRDGREYFGLCGKHYSQYEKEGV